MNIESIKTELEQTMGTFIDQLHQNHQSKVEGEQYTLFKEKLKDVIFYIVDKHKLNLMNSEKSQDFLDQLRPSIEMLLEHFYQA